MNQAVMSYRQNFARNLHCKHQEKQHALAQFDQVLTSFIEEFPDPTSSDLECAFGTPVQLAESFTMECAPRPAKKRWLSRALLGLMAVIILLSGAIFVGHEVQVSNNIVLTQETEAPIPVDDETDETMTIENLSE